MAKWTAEKRRNLPREDFGDPDNEAFPIADQSDLNDAARLIGHARNPEAVKARLRRIAKRKGLALPKSWEDAVSVKPGAKAKGKTAVAMSDPNYGQAMVSFALDESGAYRDGEMVVYPRAILFRAGDYPTRRMADGTPFARTREQLWLDVHNFDGPRWGHQGHSAEFGEGRACELRSIWLDPADHDLVRGEVAVPANLDSYLIDSERRLSAVFDPDTGEFVRVDLTSRPHIPDAVLAPAFSDGDGDGDGDGDDDDGPPAATPHGRRAMQYAHDYAAEHGALCNMKGAVEFTADHERMAFQKMHDAAVEGGAVCRKAGSRPPMFSGPARPTPNGKRGNPMSKLGDALRHLFSAGNATPEAVEALVSVASPEPAPAPTASSATQAAGVNFSELPEWKAMQERLAAAEAREKANADRIREAHLKAIADEAVTFSNGFPKPLRTNVRALYVAATLADEESREEITFSDTDGRTEKKGGHLDLLKTTLAMFPRPSAMRQVLTHADLSQAQAAAVVFNASEPEDPTDADAAAGITFSGPVPGIGGPNGRKASAEYIKELLGHSTLPSNGNGNGAAGK